jgi:hypothetical protein
VVAPQGTLASILQAHQSSAEFAGLAARTRRDYVDKIGKVIEPAFADFPIAALTDRRTRSVFMAWRDKLAAKSRRQADYTWSVFARILSWALDRGSARPDRLWTYLRAVREREGKRTSRSLPLGGHAH